MRSRKESKLTVAKGPTELPNTERITATTPHRRRRRHPHHHPHTNTHPRLPPLPTEHTTHGLRLSPGEQQIRLRCSNVTVSSGPFRFCLVRGERELNVERSSLCRAHAKSRGRARRRSHACFPPAVAHRYYPPSSTGEAAGGAPLGRRRACGAWRASRHRGGRGEGGTGRGGGRSSAVKPNLSLRSSNLSLGGPRAARGGARRPCGGSYLLTGSDEAPEMFVKPNHEKPAETRSQRSNDRPLLPLLLQGMMGKNPHCSHSPLLRPPPPPRPFLPPAPSERCQMCLCRPLVGGALSELFGFTAPSQ